MKEKFLYYVDLLSELCGYDGSDGTLVFGWVVVGIASLIVIGAFYFSITRSLWPGEDNPDHIKRRILLDDEEVPHAH